MEETNNAGQQLDSYLFGGESEKAFALQHPNGNPVIVAKDSLSPETQEKIRGLSTMDEEQKKPFMEKVGRHIGGSIKEGVSSAVDAFGTMAGTVATPVAQFGKGLLNSASGYDPNAQAVPEPTLSPVSNSPGVDFGPAVTEQPVAPAQQPSQQILPPTGAEMMKPFELQQRAAKMQLDYDNLAAKQSADILKTQLEQNQKTEAEFAARDSERQKHIDDQVRDFSDPNKQIDPSRKWNSMGTGNKILAAISIALSGMGSNWTGGKNLALDVINKAVDDDINAQKENRSNKKSLYQMYIDQGKSDREATNLVKSIGLAKAELQMKLYAANNAGLLNNKKYLDTTAELQGKQLQLRKDFSRMGLDQRLNSGGGTWQELTTYGTPDQKKLAMPIAGTDKYLQFGDEKTRSESQASITAFKNISYKLDRLNQLGKKALLTKEGREEAEQLIASTTGELLKSNDLTKLSPQTAKLLEAQLSNPTKFTQWVLDNPAEANTRLKGFLMRDLVNELQGKVMNPQNLPYVLGPPQQVIPNQKFGTKLKNASFNK